MKIFHDANPPHISRRLLTLPFFPFLLCDFPSSQPFFRSWEFAFAPSPVSHKCWIWGGSRRGEVGGSQRPCVMTYSFHLRPLLTWRLVLCLLNYTMRSLLCSIVIIYHSDIIIYMCVPNTQIVHIFSTTFTIIIVIIISDQQCRPMAHTFSSLEGKTSIPFKWLTLIRLYCFITSSSQKSWNWNVLHQWNL